MWAVVTSQRQLFDFEPPKWAAPIARRSDPPTSQEAAERYTRTRRASDKARVLAALREHSGVTSWELAERSGLDRYLCARRLPDLERDGTAEKCGRTESGVVWRARGG